MNGVSRITVAEDISLVTISNQTSDSILIGNIFTEFAREGIVIDMISQTAPQGSTMDISFTTHSQHVVKVLGVISRIKDKYRQIKIMVSTGNCKIQLYGEEMREMNGVAARAIMSLVESSVDIIMITTSEIDISLIVSPANQLAAIKKLEASFGIKAAV